MSKTLLNKFMTLLAVVASVYILVFAVEARQREHQGPPPMGDFFEIFDTDYDGLVSMLEFPGPADHFDRFDANSDGYIDADEAPTGPPPGPNRGDRPDDQTEGIILTDIEPHPPTTDQEEQYPLVDTGLTDYYDNTYEISQPGTGDNFYGQDANYTGRQPAYQDNNDGTITDLNTGLMWQKDPGEKKTWEQVMTELSSFELAGYTDWRLPTIKELYSLILFSGVDPDPRSTETESLTPFIAADVFNFKYGDPEAGERIIDSQFMSSTLYVSTTMGGSETVFGVNFADGRIKGYPLYMRGTGKPFYVLYVRGDSEYGKNNFIDNLDGTITDLATGLMWMKQDSGSFDAGDSNNGAMDWEQALEWSENLEHAGYSDWRLPDAKELQSIVDYTRSPATTQSPAIDPVFETTAIIDEGGNLNYPFFWSGTTHKSLRGGSTAAYVAFGEALGFMQRTQGYYELMDVHGAGAQRSDPKTGDPSEFPYGRGPQGDVIRIQNFVRCVRTMN